MRSIITATAVILAAVALAACGPIDNTSPPGGDPTGGSETMGIGDTITLTDSSGVSPEHIAVTLVQVVFSASPSRSGFSPQSGDQWVAVQFRVKNLDEAPYIDSPNKSASAVDAAGQSIPAQDDAPTTVGLAFSNSLALTTGSTATGVVTFEVASGDKITTVLFTTDFGDGTDVGKWTVDSNAAA
jgi:hypothetical protein